ncbi:serine/threonine protein kinase [Nitriliruptoraceae bacterium ZYF776]|nr:serine/threonine protein kinase [Profundirhabdus halotolerans]
MNRQVLPQVGRYRAVEVIGTGAYSAVHRAVDERLDDVVAIKLLGDNHSLDPEVRERFLAEGRVLRRIDSPHVVRVHDLGETDRGQPYLVLEYADRGTLAARVTRLRADGWRPTAEDLLAVVGPLAAALDAVHGADVVHRDLSPSNVLIRSTLARRPRGGGTVLAPDERLLLADLGLCKDLALHSGMTVAGGTEGFRPPEQRGGPGQISARADLWALSALAVWLLRGEPPAPDASSAEVVASVGLPAALAEVLDRGLSADPDARQPDVGTWLRVVRGALGVDGPGPSIAPPVGPPGAGAASPRGTEDLGRSGLVGGWRRPLLAAVVGLVLGMALVVGLTRLAGGPSVTRTDDGQVRVERVEGDATLAISGPAEATVGETVTFRAETEGFDTWVWVDPAGSLHVSRAIDVTPSSTGSATLRLVGFQAGQAAVEVDLRLRVVE